MERIVHSALRPESPEVAPKKECLSEWRCCSPLRQIREQHLLEVSVHQSVTESKQERLWAGKDDLRGKE